MTATMTSCTTSGNKDVFSQTDGRTPSAARAVERKEEQNVLNMPRENAAFLCERGENIGDYLLVLPGISAWKGGWEMGPVCNPSLHTDNSSRCIKMQRIKKRKTLNGVVVLWAFEDMQQIKWDLMKAVTASVLVQIKERKRIMGWPKYFEDNNEIIQERVYFQSAVDEIDGNSDSITKGSLLNQNSYSPRKVCVNMSKTAYPPRRGIDAICRECGVIINYTKKLQLFLEKNGWEGPQLCKKCLQKRAQASLGKRKH